MPDFDKVLEQERNEEIYPHRAPRSISTATALATSESQQLPADQTQRPIVGLAFSGGGIRSATFNLGILQGLAKFKLLERIDYLSTVSGGGYIGSWLITWIKRASTQEVQQKLGEYESNPDTDPPDPIPAPEPEEINFLRDYSNYLTPRKGIFGADTWAGIATYARNVLLNQLILVSFLGGILFLPWVAVQARAWIPNFLTDFNLLAALSAAFTLFTIVMASYQVALCSRTDQPAPKIAQQPLVLLSIVLPLFLSALCSIVLLWNEGIAARHATLSSLPAHGILFWVILIAALYGSAHLLGLVPRWIVTHKLPPDQTMSPWAWPLIPIFAAVAGAIGGTLVFLLAKLIAYWQSSFAASADFYTASFGPPAIVLIFLLVGTIHIGLLRLLIEPAEQEWWARLSGWLMIWSLAWTGLFSLAIFGPFGELFFAAWVKTKFALFSGWVLTTVAGLLSGRSKKTTGTSAGNPSDNQTLEGVARIAPYVFVIGLLVVLSLGVHALAAHLPIELPKNIRGTVTMRIIQTTSAEYEAQRLQAVTNTANYGYQAYWLHAAAFSAKWLLVTCLSFFAIALLLAFRIDINTFSMNLLYRNRIVRCYLGATRPEESRHANPFTGFDPQDDQLLKNFSRHACGPGSEKKYDGPYPIFCAALNVTHGERLAWQERKAESFVFTPRYCGFDFPEMHLHPALPESYRPTYAFAYPRSSKPEQQKEIGGMHVGTAMSISGAAASPNMGYHTSPPLAFLMTMFDVRLGWWLPNPRHASEEYAFKRPEGGPRVSLLYLLHELFASTTDRSKYVYVSDGGHFESLGIYELVRRRCQFIIASDADADESMAFGDLGNAIRKCRSDFGVEITINLSPLSWQTTVLPNATRSSAPSTIRNTVTVTMSLLRWASCST
jgi:Patatin-like phospholipase.